MSRHEPLPHLVPKAFAAVTAFLDVPTDRPKRQALAAFLREAMKQARWDVDPGAAWADLHAIADNLYPPPPTLAQAREAARQLAGPSAEIVHAFLATLGEGVLFPNWNAPLPPRAEGHH